VEVFSVMRSEKAIDSAHVCVLVIDATSGVTTQDKKIAGLIQKARRPALVALNKWDLIPGGSDPDVLRDHLTRVREKLFFLDYAPVVVLSARTGENVRRVFTSLEKIRQHAGRRVGTGELNRLLRAAMGRQPAPMKGNRRFKLLYATQARADENHFPIAKFVLFVNDPRLLSDAYLHYLSARIREKWAFPGTPIVFNLRGREDRQATKLD
jgi:GTP-binding protein